MAPGRHEVNTDGKVVRYDRREWDTTDLVSSRAAQFVRKGDGPFFAFIAPHDPHSPYYPPPPPRSRLRRRHHAPEALRGGRERVGQTGLRPRAPPALRRAAPLHKSDSRGQVGDPANRG